jgi:hypothetical protein
LSHGHWVAKSVAADPAAAWTNTSAERQFFNSVAIGIAMAVVLAYALSAVVFGHLPVLLPEGFVTLQGISARVMATGSLALAMGWGSHLVQRHWSSASSVNCRAFRRWCYITTIICWGAILPMEALNLPLSPRWAGLAPASEVLFWPLPRVWRDLLPLASNRVTANVFLTGIVTLVLSFIFLRVFEWPRVFLLFLGAAACAAGFYFLGSAVFEYGSPRGLQGVSADFAKEFNANPGHYNAWNFLSWLGALACLAYAAVLIAAALVIHAQAPKAIATRS